MPTLIPAPTIIHAAGNKPKRIEGYAGRVNTGQGGSMDVSAGQAIMTRPGLPAFSPDTVHRDTTS
jgi:hypothetical protein